MTTPVALLYYDQLVAGAQVANHLQDMGYRVLTIASPRQAVEQAVQNRALIFIGNLSAPVSPVASAVLSLKASPETAHIPVLLFIPAGEPKLDAPARALGVKLVASDAGIPQQLPQLLDQALSLDSEDREHR